MCHLPNPSTCLPAFTPSFFPSLPPYPPPPSPLHLTSARTVPLYGGLPCTHLSSCISERSNMQCAMSGLSSFLFKCPHSKFWWLAHFSLWDPLGRFVSVRFCLVRCAALAACFSAHASLPSTLFRRARWKHAGCFHLLPFTLQPDPQRIWTPGNRFTMWKQGNDLEFEPEREQSLKMDFIKAKISPPNSRPIFFLFRRNGFLIRSTSRYARVFFFSAVAANSHWLEGVNIACRELIT